MKIPVTEVELDKDRLEASGLPKAFWNFQADTYTGDEHALQECDKYVQKFAAARARNLGLFIRGGAETQKTFLASYVLRRLLMRPNVQARYCSFSDLVDSVFEKQMVLRDWLREADVLVLDNLGVPASSFWPTLLNRVLTQRKDDHMPTIVVTQLWKDREQDLFAASYGEANLRLIEHLSHTIHAIRDETQMFKDESRRKSIFADEV